MQSSDQVTSTATESSKRGGRIRRRSATAAAVVALTLGFAGAGFSACGDDDEGPAEDAGQAIDDAGQEAGQEIDEAGQEAGQEIDEETKDAKDKE